MPDNPTIVYRRAELYDLVWARPLREVSKSLGLTDIQLATICRRLGVPIPWRGYWSDRAAGKAAEPTPLPPRAAGEPDEIRSPRGREAAEAPTSEDVDARIHVEPQLTDPHPLVIATAQALREAAPEHGLLVTSAPGCLDVAVGPASVDRALRLLDALLKGAERHGAHPAVIAAKAHTDGYSRREEPTTYRAILRIGEDQVAFRLDEATESVLVPPAPPPPPPKRRRWDYEPPSLVPTYEYRPTGRLSLRILSSGHVATQSNWNDSKRKQVEDCLDSFLAQCLRIARVQQEARNAAERQRVAEAEARQKREAAEAEARRIKAEQERMRKAEQARVDDLEARLHAWHQSWIIRDFIAVVEADAGDRGLPMEPGSALATWLAWAGERAQALATTALAEVGHRQLASPAPPTSAEVAPSAPPPAPPSYPDMPPKSYWETRQWWQRR
jgi:hypothetical protein